MRNITNTRILYFRNKGNKRPSETHSIFSFLSSTLSTTPFLLAAKAKNRQPTFTSSDFKADHQHAISCPKSLYFNRQFNLSTGAQNSAPQYLSLPILCTPVSLIQLYLFLLHCLLPQYNWSFVLSLSFEFWLIMTRPTDSNCHKTDNASYASTSSFSLDFSKTLEKQYSRTLKQMNTLLQKYLKFKIAKFSQII